ncbi:MAG: hypothetical protein UX71_C0001G0094 [Parcubacteria group bacterium GW2011_GWA1_47_10]|uniref:Uncharacterized protein n=1 Tax=Candidatus Nomurabacteria bacterium GW2011_GWB1_47_6 TaxID=1618749 RepID=A0A0G1T171_9BACT|nr:MAG: hypothetical protein UX71_C0001G0094 [Parcubacteria group bacterium GW2011_GWA1_47_10]KKU75509.1 MAG: hypothetical protein UY01_C0011G0016 [Candidatus Nomurabacteria bacterium GW2011_GWB1_47_6]
MDDLEMLDEVILVAILSPKSETGNPDELSKKLSKLFGQQIDVAGPWKQFSFVLVIEGEETEVLGKLLAVGLHGKVT